MTLPSHRSATRVSLAFAFASAFAVLTGGVASDPARAQSAAVAAPPLLETAKPDTFMTLVPPRDTDDIEQDRDAARAEESYAQELLAAAVDREAQEKAEAELQKAEVARINAEIDLLDKQKDETGKKSAEIRKKAAELRQKLLERRRDMRSAEKALAEAIRKAAAARARACDREHELANRRAENPPFTANDASALARRLKWENDIRELEKAALEAYRDASSEQKTALEREGDVLSKRLDVLAAQRDIIAAASK